MIRNHEQHDHELTMWPIIRATVGGGRIASTDNRRSKSVKALASHLEAEERLAGGHGPPSWLRRRLGRQEPPRRDTVRGNAVPPIFLERPHGSQQGLAGYRLDDERPIPQLHLCVVVEPIMVVVLVTFTVQHHQRHGSDRRCADARLGASYPGCQPEDYDHKKQAAEKVHGRPL